MARGWESKSIESQIEEATQEKDRGMRLPPVAPEDSGRLAKLHRLMLDRTRVLSEIEATSNPRFRIQLELELKFLDCEIGKLGGV